jgi:hypothetical protein
MNRRRLLESALSATAGVAVHARCGLAQDGGELNTDSIYANPATGADRNSGAKDDPIKSESRLQSVSIFVFQPPSRRLRRNRPKCCRFAAGTPLGTTSPPTAGPETPGRAGSTSTTMHGRHPWRHS